MNTITLELCAEDRARLDKILAALEKPRDCKGCVETVSKATEHIVEIMTPQEPENEPQEAPEVKADEHPADVSTAPWDPVEEPQEDAPSVTENDIRQKFMALSIEGKGDKARAIIKSYAAKISAVPEDKRAECIERLNELERQPLEG